MTYSPYKYLDLTERNPEQGAEMSKEDEQIELDAVTQMADDEFHDLFAEAMGEVSDDDMTKLQIAFLQCDNAEFGKLAQNYYMQYVRRLYDMKQKMGELL